jgi:hypothetical protein
MPSEVVFVGEVTAGDAVSNSMLLPLVWSPAHA